MWLGLLAVAVVLHLKFHPLSYVFRDGLRWIVSYPAPLLIYAASLMAAGLLNWKYGRPSHVFEFHEGLPFWGVIFLRTFEDLVWIFHRAVLPLPILHGTIFGALIQALIASLTQVALCCYLVMTLQTGEGLLQRTLARLKGRWMGVLLLAVLQWPWWYFFVGTQSIQSVWAKFFYLELLGFLAPAALVLTVSGKQLTKLGGRICLWWLHCWKPIVGLVLTAFPILALQTFALNISESYLLDHWSPFQVLLRCIIVATLHTWLFASSAIYFVSSTAVTQSKNQRGQA